MQSSSPLDNLTPESTLSQIVSAERQAEELLASIGLNPHDHLEQTLRSVCRERKWNEEEVLSWLQRHGTAETGESENVETDPEDWSLEQWHRYMKGEFFDPNLALLREIENDFPRVLKIHGRQYCWLKEVRWHFDTFAETLSMHYLFKTEKFQPVAERCARQSKDSLLYGTLQKLRRGFDILEEDRRKLGGLMDTLRERSGNFEHPSLACSTFRILNQNILELFENLEKEFETERQRYLPLLKQESEAAA